MGKSVLERVSEVVDVVSMLVDVINNHRRAAARADDEEPELLPGDWDELVAEARKYLDE